MGKKGSAPTAVVNVGREDPVEAVAAPDPRGRACSMCSNARARPNALNEAATPWFNRGGRILPRGGSRRSRCRSILAYLVRNNIYVFGIRGEGKRRDAPRRRAGWRKKVLRMRSSSIPIPSRSPRCRTAIHYAAADRISRTRIKVVVQIPPDLNCPPTRVLRVSYPRLGIPPDDATGRLWTKRPADAVTPSRSAPLARSRPLSTLLRLLADGRQTVGKRR